MPNTLCEEAIKEHSMGEGKMFGFWKAWGALFAFGLATAAVSFPGAPQTEPQARPPASSVTAGRISGRVVRADNRQPLAKAVVTLWLAEQPRETLSTRTDSNGNYQFPEVPPGTYRLRAQRRGFVAQLYGQRGSGPGLTVPLAAGEDKTGVDFTLTPAGVITGTIYDEDFEPVEDVEVAALRLRFVRGGKRTAQFVRTVRTNDLGQYRLAGLEPGFYIVQTAGRGPGIFLGTSTASFDYVPAFYQNATTQDEARQVQVVAGGETTGIDISARTGPTYTISGTVVDTTVGTGRKRYSVGFARGVGIATMESHEAGFAFRGLTPGEYTLVAIAAEESRALDRRGTKVKRCPIEGHQPTLRLSRRATVGFATNG